MMNWRKIKFYLSLHWIKLILAAIVIATLTLTAVILINGIRAWKEAEALSARNI